VLGAWANRSTESRSLFNPAFCSLLIAVAVKEYDAERTSGGMPLLMAYLLLPISLHTATRESLPSTTRTSLAHWVIHNPEIHIGLPERVIAFRSITSEAIRFAILEGILSLNDFGELTHVPRKPRGLQRFSQTSTEVAACFKAAQDLGRWYARVPSTTFLLHLLRIRP